MPHGKNVFKTASNIAKATICAYPSSKYALPNCECALHCFTLYLFIDLPIPESYQHNYNVGPTIHFMCIT